MEFKSWIGTVYSYSYRQEIKTLFPKNPLWPIWSTIKMQILGRKTKRKKKKKNWKICLSVGEVLEIRNFRFRHLNYLQQQSTKSTSQNTTMTFLRITWKTDSWYVQHWRTFPQQILQIWNMLLKFWGKTRTFSSQTTNHTLLAPSTSCSSNCNGRKDGKRRPLTINNSLS